MGPFHKPRPDQTMGKNTTKKFVDKKNAQSFVLAHSSGASQNETVAEQEEKLRKLNQQPALRESEPVGPVVEIVEEEGEQEQATHLLEQPSTSGASQNDKDVMNLGLPDDGYDYSKHLRDPGGGGHYVSASADALDDQRFEGLDVMDDDMKRALGLLGDESDGGEELEDDFMQQLVIDNDAQDEGPSSKSGGPVLITEGKWAGWYRYDDGDAGYDEDEVEVDVDKDYTTWQRETREATLLDEQLDKMMDEYDDDEIGELEDSEQTRGVVTSSDHYEPELNEFLRTAPIGEVWVRANQPEGAAKDLHLVALADRRDADTAEDVEDQKKALEWVKQVIKVKPEADEELQPDEVVVVKEEIEQWDCETILTTYSNLENHPKLVGPVQRIRLDPKTGMPLGTVLPFAKEAAIPEETDDYDYDQESVNLGAKRDKKESAAEKKARKDAVKADKAAARQRKKESTAEMRAAPKLSGHTIGQVPAGVRVVPV